MLLLLLLLLLMLLLVFATALSVRRMNVMKLNELKPRLPTPPGHPAPRLDLYSTTMDDVYQ